jgi:RNA polymerase sigma-70 factor, ECF subfamily
MTELPDTELMELVRGGDIPAFDELYRRYQGPIKRFLFELTWDQDTAEDYLQEVFVRLFRARERYQPTGKFSTYLFQIAKNYYLERRRNGLRRPEQNLVSIDGDPFRNIRANERVEPETHLMEAYRQWRIRRAIGSLPDGQRMVFVMSHFEGMKYVEIADILGIPMGTVKSRMSIAVSKLKSFLKEDEE